MAPLEAPTPVRTVFRPLTPQRNRSDVTRGGDTGVFPSASGGVGEADRRIFKPYAVAAETTPFRGARPGVEATIAADYGAAVKGAVGNISYLSSDTDADTSVSDVVHMTSGQPQQGYANDAQRSANGGGGQQLSRSGQHYTTIRPLGAESSDLQRYHQEEVGFSSPAAPNHEERQRHYQENYATTISPAPSVGVSRIHSSANFATVPSAGGNSNRIIVRTPSHFPASLSHWEGRQAREPSLYH
jgi:hypothetical protein